MNEISEFARRGPARGFVEMNFAMSLRRCPGCAMRIDEMQLDFYRTGTAATFSGKCPGCGTVNVVHFTLEGDPFGVPSRRGELGDERPSKVVLPEDFLEEIQRLAPLVCESPRTIVDAAAWSTSSHAVTRTMTCVVELLKFPREALPHDIDADALPSMHARIRELAGLHTADAPRYWMLRDGYVATSDEIRGLLLQAHRRMPTVADLQAYLASRNARDDGTISDACRVEVWADDRSTFARVFLADGTLADVGAAIDGLIFPRFEDYVANSYGRVRVAPLVEGHTLDVIVESNRDHVRHVTIGFPGPIPYSTSFGAAYLEQGADKSLTALMAAEAEAVRSGKERFDLARFEAILEHGSQRANEHSHRVAYYLSHSEMRTLAEYAAYLHEVRSFD